MGCRFVSGQRPRYRSECFSQPPGTRRHRPIRPAPISLDMALALAANPVLALSPKLPLASLLPSADPFHRAHSPDNRPPHTLQRGGRRMPDPLTASVTSDCPHRPVHLRATQHRDRPVLIAARVSLVILPSLGERFLKGLWKSQQSSTVILS